MDADIDHIVEHELQKPWPWLTENRTFAIAAALFAVGIYMGLSAWL